jgi:hypothetical protein
MKVVGNPLGHLFLVIAPRLPAPPCSQHISVVAEAIGDRRNVSVSTVGYFRVLTL